jgi:hypothetical protein
LATEAIPRDRVIDPSDSTWDLSAYKPDRWLRPAIRPDRWEAVIPEAGV